MASPPGGCGCDLPIIVTIPSVEIPNTLIPGQKPAKYLVVTEAFGLRSEVPRVFDDFEKFHADIKQFINVFPSEVRKKLTYAVPALPERLWMGNELAGTVQDRRSKLEDFLQKLLTLVEIVSDSEERLWKFLQLHLAASSAARLVTTCACGPWLRTLCEASHRDEGLVSLRHAVVEESLVQIVKGAIGLGGLFVDNVNQDELRIVCSLLERVFVHFTDRCRSGEVISNIADALLALVTCESAEDSLKEATSSALVCLIKVDTHTWQEALRIMLDGDGLQKFAAACGKTPSDEVENPTGGDNGETQAEECESKFSPPHLVAEILLRGFDGAVVEKFIAPELAEERKRLLNALFLSPDLFVRLVVGLLLARLICEPAFAEAVKAASGLRSLCVDLFARVSEFACSGIGQILAEEFHWTWLCRLLASPEPAVSGYALILVKHAVDPTPARVMETSGMQDSLVALAGPSSDQVVRKLAARLLLATHCGDEAYAPIDPFVMATISDAIAADTELSLCTDGERQAELGDGVAAVRGKCNDLFAAKDLLIAAHECVSKLRAESEAWTASVTMADEMIIASELGERACSESLQEHRSKRELLLSQLPSRNHRQTDGNTDGLVLELQRSKTELAKKEAEVEDRTRQLEEKVKKKMDICRDISEDVDEMKKWDDLAASAEERENNPSADQEASSGQRAMLRPHECRSRQQEAKERVARLRAQEEELNQEVQELSEPLPSLREIVDTQRRRVMELTCQTGEVRQRHAALLAEWGTLLEARRSCGEELEGLSDCLEKARGSLGPERLHRRGLRTVIRSLVEALTDLDGQLELLGPEDGSEEIEP